MFVYVVPLMLDRNRATKDKVQWSAVTVTPSGIGKSVTITDCHSNSVTLLVLNESGIAKTVAVADCHSNHCHSNRRPLYVYVLDMLGGYRQLGLGCTRWSVRPPH